MAFLNSGAGDAAWLKQSEYNKPNSSLVSNDSREKNKKRKAAVDARENSIRRSLLTNTDDTYVPSTKEIQAAYETMLNIIQRQLGRLACLIYVFDVANEILTILKNESIENPEKKIMIEKLFNPSLPDGVFDQLVYIGEFITDYPQEVRGDSASVEPHVEESDVDAGQAKESTTSVTVEEVDKESDLDAGQAKESRTSVNVEEVDAYWLQRKLFEGYEERIDPLEREEIAQGLLEILGEEENDVDVENKLFVHLRFEKFGLVKFLIHNRLRLVWCTRLARARDQDERNQIAEAMIGLGPEFAAIVDELQKPKNEHIT